ncbi:hypothetical protein ACFWXK_14290 [Streptomyces sp. NPDC059070]|uniref:hypothetical protein n=1 Tax=Streptomyces sp. NPDC059070 TaxID=3346713 RepID=UPI003691C90E
MRLRRARKPWLAPGLSEADRNRLRNIDRILNPPRLTLRQWCWCQLWAVEEFWQRHVTRRELFRQFDNLRKHLKQTAGESRSSTHPWGEHH